MRSILEHFVAPFDRSTTPRDLRRTRSFNEPSFFPARFLIRAVHHSGGKINPSTSNKITESPASTGFLEQERAFFSLFAALETSPREEKWLIVREAKRQRRRPSRLSTVEGTAKESLKNEFHSRRLTRKCYYTLERTTLPHRDKKNSSKKKKKRNIPVVDYLR